MPQTILNIKDDPQAVSQLSCFIVDTLKNDKKI